MMTFARERSPLLCATAALMLAVGSAVTFAAPRALAQCKTDSGRPCTGTEEMKSCLDNSVVAYKECKEDASGFWENAYCFGKYELDFYMCVPKLLK